MHLPQERQARRVLSFEQDDNQRKFRGRPDMPVVGLVVFRDLPLSESGLADQENKCIRLGDFLRQLGAPRTTGAQMRRGEEHPRCRILRLDSVFEPRGQRLVRRVITEKPAAHSTVPVNWQDINLAAKGQRLFQFLQAFG